jgi:hypothetical protein
MRHLHGYVNYRVLRNDRVHIMGTHCTVIIAYFQVALGVTTVLTMTTLMTTTNVSHLKWYFYLSLSLFIAGCYAQSQLCQVDWYLSWRLFSNGIRIAARIYNRCKYSRTRVTIYLHNFYLEVYVAKRLKRIQDHKQKYTTNSSKGYVFSGCVLVILIAWLGSFSAFNHHPTNVINCCFPNSH